MRMGEHRRFGFLFGLAGKKGKRRCSPHSKKG
jgi:hypothetical protein